ncbi:hypothetical protein EDB19DRAFT_1831768 [Suillus lakei]|nr:hypothetical protein EDB19DRAFT_1831768 [Suillus lakei]
MRGGPGLALEVIAGMNLAIPSNRTPAGLYVLVSTPYGQINTTSKVATTDCSVVWNQTLTIHGRPLKFPRWLMPIFSRKSKAVHLEIRASFESGLMLGRGELVGTFETTFEQLLAQDGRSLSLLAVDNQRISLKLKAQRSKTTRIDNHAAGGTEQSEIGHSTDAARDAYLLFRRSNLSNDLDNSIRGFQAVLDQCPPGHPDRAAALSNLAHAVLYGYTKNIRTDIDHAISLFRSALDLRPPGHPDHLLSNIDLCQAFQHRYSHEQGHADLREAIDLSHYLLPLCVEGSYLHGVALGINNILAARQISASEHRDRHHDQRSAVSSTEIPGPERRLSPPPLSTPSSHREVRGLFLDLSLLLIKYHRRVRGEEMLSYSAKLAWGKVQSSIQFAQQELAKTSNDGSGCTPSAERHPVEISGQRFILFDTAGLNEGSEGTVPAAKAEKQLKKSFALLVYCVRSTSSPHIHARAYNTFYAGICQKKVPIVVVATGLERETRMESWWDMNREKFESHGMHFAGHACVTALQEYEGIPKVFLTRIAGSSETLRDLVVNNCSDWAPTTGGSSVLRERGAPRRRRGQRTE